jgi:cytochrome b
MGIGFITAMGLAVLGEDTSVFLWHTLAGLIIAFSVLLRLVWMVVGTRHAHFSALAYSPSSVVRYLRGALTHQHKPYATHNPASAYAIVVMIALVLALACTGVLMSSGIEAAEEIHGPLAWALVAMAVVHVVGVTLYAFRNHDGLPLSILTGRKLAPASAAIRSTRPLAGLGFVAMVTLFGASIILNYDPVASHTHVPLLGTTIQLGEAEHEQREHEQRDRDHRARHDGRT